MVEIVVFIEKFNIVRKEFSEIALKTLSDAVDEGSQILIFFGIEYGVEAETQDIGKNPCLLEYLDLIV